jgi:26S proteasome regulatory subunit N7
MSESAATVIERIPDYNLADYIFILKSSHLRESHENAQSSLLNTIKENHMAPLYYHLHVEALPNIIPWDESLYNELKQTNNKEIKELEAKIEEAEKDEEDLTIVESWTRLGNYYAKIGDRENSIKTLRKAFDLTASSGSKIDISLTIIRIGFFYDDKPFIAKELDAVKFLIDRGGDWERRNRYKTYNGLYLMSARKFNEAAELFIDSLATFTSTEISTYERIVEFAVLCGAISLDRVDLKRKVIDSSEVLSLIPTTPELEPLTRLTNSLYTCEYGVYFQALATVEEEFLKKSRFLAPHASYYVREMRRKAYAQLLESYKTLSMKSMADAFGVTVQFLDNDLSKFVPQKKLNCVIDRVNGIIVTNRPDNKNAQYQQLVKQGDALLTKLQKYGAAVRLSGAERVA